MTIPRVAAGSAKTFYVYDLEIKVSGEYGTIPLLPYDPFLSSLYPHFGWSPSRRILDAPPFEHTFFPRDDEELT